MNTRINCFFIRAFVANKIGLTICIILELKHFFSHEYTNEIFIRVFVAKNLGTKKPRGLAGLLVFYLN